MEHAEARGLLSARFDGELPAQRRSDLDAHLAGCAECRGFADALGRLGALTAELPREEPGELFARRREVAPRLRPAFRLAPAIAAVLTVVLVLVLGAPPGFKVPVADAARALTSIRTLYAEREVSQFGEILREKIWFSAPGFLRVERTSARGTEIIVERPGERYQELGAQRSRTIGLPPDVNILPEPLSPTIELLGQQTGQGPLIGGHKTIRYELDLGQERTRTVDVDAEGFTVLGITESLVLNKEAITNGDTVGRKRVLAIQINRPIDPSRFSIPSIPATDEGWKPVSSARVELAPLRTPNGFRLTAAVAGPEGTRRVFARDSFAIQVDVGSEEPHGDTSTSSATGVMVAGRHATIIQDLYRLPSISFDLLGRVVTITAPMTPDELIETARTMYLS